MATRATAAQAPGLEFSIPPTPLIYSERNSRRLRPAADFTAPSGFDQNPSPDLTLLDNHPFHFKRLSCHSLFFPFFPQVSVGSTVTVVQAKLEDRGRPEFGALRDRSHSLSSPGRGV